MLIELRRTLGIYIKDPIEIFVDADTIILKKQQETCCNSVIALKVLNRVYKKLRQLF